MTSSNDRRAKRIGLGKRIVFVVVVLVGAALLVEVGFRVAAGSLGVDVQEVERFRSYCCSGRSPSFTPRAYYSYVYQAGHGVSALGFHSTDYPTEKPPGVFRISCLGGSTTDCVTGKGLESSYPYQLEAMLRARGGGEVQVMSWGMPAWTTSEILVNYFLNVQDTAPDVVIFHEAVNDVAPRMWPGYRPDYCHYRTPWTVPRFAAPLRWLVRCSSLAAYVCMRLQGENDVRAFVTVPVDERTLPKTLEPGTASAYRRNVRTICEHAQRHGARPVLATLPYHLDHEYFEAHKIGIEEHNDILRELAAENGWLLVDIAAEFKEHWAERKPEFLDIVHVTERGNRIKAELIAGALGESGVFPGAAK